MYFHQKGKMPILQFGADRIVKSVAKVHCPLWAPDLGKGREPTVDMHSQCIGKPCVTFPAHGHHSLPISQYQIVLVREAHVCEQFK